MENRHLLIVENSSKDRQILLNALREFYYLYEASNGMEAIEQINKYTVDLVIMAYELPEVDGIETFMDMKTLRPSLPVILTSSYFISELILKAFRLGIRDFFRKPLNLKEIRETVGLILGYIEEKEETRRNVLFDRYIKSEVDAYMHSGIERARIFVEENYDKPISLVQIADQASLSKYHCSRVFKKEVGVSFSKYLARIRIEKAKELLMKGEHPIACISTLVGYNDITYFERVFKNITGLTPSTYRKKSFRLSL